MGANLLVKTAVRRPLLVVSRAWLAAALAALSIGCNYSATAELRTSDDASNHANELRIGYQKSNVLLNLIRVRKLLEQKLEPDVHVVWQEFPAGPQLLEGLNIGSIDFGCTGEVPPVFAQAADAPLLSIGTGRPRGVAGISGGAAAPGRAEHRQHRFWLHRRGAAGLCPGGRRTVAFDRNRTSTWCGRNFRRGRSSWKG